MRTGLGLETNKPGCFLGGVTLVEIMITMLVLAILIIAATPSFKNFLMNNRVSAKMDSFFNVLQYARNTALSNNINVRVCPVGASGSTVCGTSWGAGYMVVDLSTSTLLQRHPADTNDPTLSAVAVSGVTPSSITFDSRGLATTQAYFIVCDSRGSAYARSLEVLQTGYVQVGSTLGQAVWNNGSIVCP